MDDEFSSAAGKLHEPKMTAKRSMSGGVRVVRGGGRKDRHSKVWTARGTKDRRVRLSPKTAILFYDVQERLGYDRPSKAIDWLMKEARPAIDALHDPSAPPPANRNHSATIATNVAESNGDNPVSSGFSVLFDGGAVPPLLQASISRREDCREQFLSAPTPPTPLEIMFDASSEIARLQRIFSWNHAGEDYSSLHYPAPAANAHVFAEWEPLQSSYSTDSPQFQGFGFPNFCDAATFKGEGDDDNIPVLSNSFSTASSFLGYAE